MSVARGAVTLAAVFFIVVKAHGEPTLASLGNIMADRSLLEAAVEAGRKQASFCFNCHGEYGISMQPEVPNLAGQPAAYLVEQIRRFGDGRRRDVFMQGLIKALRDDEKINIALYFAAQPLRPAGNSAGDAELGKPLYQKLCLNCHGTAGRGNDVTPTVAGQQFSYLVTSTRRYRDRTGERQHKEMSEAVARMSNADIANVSAYLARMR